MNTHLHFSNLSNPRRGTRRLSLETAEPRVMLSAGSVFWQNDTPPANGFSAEIRGKSLVFFGNSGRDYVLVHDIVANKWHENWDSDLVLGQHYIEIQHRHQQTLRRAWVEQDPTLEFVFLGGDGDDYFHYIETSGDPAPRHTRRIIAFGGSGEDSLHGFSDDDILVGGEDNDSLFGELGSDLLIGGPGDDTLWGDNVSNPDRQQHVDTDYLVGGVGEDVLRGWQGGDLLNGGDFGNVDDGQLDFLYGQEHRDCFYFESSEVDVRNDYDPKVQMDEKVVSDVPRVHGHSPSLVDWLQTYHPDLNLPFADQVNARLPRIGPKNYRVLMPATLGFNCHAGALSILCQNVPQDVTQAFLPSWYDNHFARFGFTPDGNADPNNLPHNDGWERIILFGRDATWGERLLSGGRVTWVPTHSVLQLSDGSYASKLDTDGPLIVHDSLDDLESHYNIYTKEFVSYGRPRRVYIREKLDTICNGVLPSTHTSAVLVGDVNQDGIFDSSDLIRVFEAGKYANSIPAAYNEGDWNGDGVFDSADLVYVFQAASYTAMVRPTTRTTAAVDRVFADDELADEQLPPEFADVALR